MHQTRKLSITGGCHGGGGAKGGVVAVVVAVVGSGGSVCESGVATALTVE